MTPTRDALLGMCAEGVRQAVDVGAYQVEIFADSTHRTKATLQNDDLSEVEISQNAQFGIRVVTADGQSGFATTTRPDTLRVTAEEAIAMARSGPADPLRSLAEPRPIADVPDAVDPMLLDISPQALTEQAAGVLVNIRDIDERIRVERGNLEIESYTVAIVSSTGVQGSWRGADVSFSLMGMAIDGDDIGTLTADYGRLRRARALPDLIHRIQHRFAETCLSSLNVRRGESARCAIVLAPQALSQLMLRPLMRALSARQVREGRSPFVGKMDTIVAAAGVDLIEMGAQPTEFPLTPFDREGMPRQQRPLIADGALRGYLWSDYEARAANVDVVGNTQGSALGPPMIGPLGFTLNGPILDVFADGPVLLVQRFSGSTDAVSGDFSGVVKSGLMVHGDERVPVSAITIAGNLFDCLKTISGVSSHRQVLGGVADLPFVRVEDVSITAG
ncbi:MAG: TldD/PmbA family protein [Myxococcota bacterium]